MFSRCLVVLLFSLTLMAQPQQGPVSANKDSAAPARNSSPEASEQKNADKAKLPPDTPVITIEGLCDQPTETAARPASSDCKTVVTREQFEKLVDSLSPNMPLAVRRELANGYPRTLLFFKKAKELGLDKDPRYQEMIVAASLRALSNTLTRQLQEKAGEISDADMEKYYKVNSSRFQQYELERIFIPGNKGTAGTADTPAEKRSASEAAMKAEAEKIHAKAAAGGDFTALQEEAFAVAGLKLATANVRLGKMTRGKLPKDHQKVFDLTQGQVSELFSDANGFDVYKVISTQMIPFSEAKAQIHNTLQTERLQASMGALFESIAPQLNSAYFGGRDAAHPSPAPSASPQGGATPELPQGTPATPPH